MHSHGNVHSATEHWRDDRYKRSVLMPVSQYTISVLLYTFLANKADVTRVHEGRPQVVPDAVALVIYYGHVQQRQCV